MARNPRLYDVAVDTTCTALDGYTTSVSISRAETISTADTATKTAALARAENVVASGTLIRAILDHVSTGDLLRLYVHDVADATDRVGLRRTVADAVTVTESATRHVSIPNSDAVTGTSATSRFITKIVASDVTVTDIQKMQMSSISVADQVTSIDAPKKTDGKLISHTATVASAAKRLLRKVAASTATASDAITTINTGDTISRFNVFQHTAGDIAFSTTLAGSATYNVIMKVIRVL